MNETMFLALFSAGGDLASGGFALMTKLLQKLKALVYLIRPELPLAAGGAWCHRR
jgi:hypothetical protein